MTNYVFSVALLPNFRAGEAGRCFSNAALAPFNLLNVSCFVVTELWSNTCSDKPNQALYSTRKFFYVHSRITSWNINIDK